MAFVARQKALIENLYRGEALDDLTQEEEMVADLIRRNRDERCGLASFLHNFLAILEFDAERRGRLISAAELAWYSSRLSMAVTDGIQHFIGNDHPYPGARHRYSAVFAAHITHMLRDAIEDLPEGYINLPAEYVDEHQLDLRDPGGPAFRAWVRERVDLARYLLQEGKRYLDGLQVLRCKIAGYWYCARYEGVLSAIERDDYILRAAYRQGLLTWLRMAWLGLAITIRHLAQRMTMPGRGLGDLRGFAVKPTLDEPERGLRQT